jgi:hypothetical protein
MKLIYLFAALCMIFSLSAHAQETASATDASSTKTPVPTGKYVTGGVIGSIFGFGIGHAIQGRYADKGWIFTATEVAGVGLAAAANCKTEKDDYGDDKWTCKNGSGLYAIGVGVVLGFHIWEIVDLWADAKPVDDSSPKAYLIPDPQSPGIGVAWRF